ncbi:MAG: hypothetical protein EOM20_18175 [Spartobacteria bacterium]|nr:hypothetical protein [Spartobacteria bacterium]
MNLSSTHNTPIHAILLVGILWLVVPSSVQAQVRDTLPVRCRVLPPPLSIDIDTDSLAWRVYPTENHYRFNSSIVTCRFMTVDQGWEIRVYHTNDVVGHPLVGVGPDPQTGRPVTNGLPVKIWQNNYGPVDYYAQGIMPDPMNHNFYYGFTRYIPCVIAAQTYQDASPLPFHFIIDARFALETTYEGDIFFELFIP